MGAWAVIGLKPLFDWRAMEGVVFGVVLMSGYLTHFHFLIYGIFFCEFLYLVPSDRKICS